MQAGAESFPMTPAQSRAFAQSKDVAYNMARQSLTTLANGDSDLGNAAFNAVLKMKAAGVPLEDQYNAMAGLASIKRIDSDPTIPVDNTFYINRFSGGSGQNLTNWDNLVTVAPSPGADLSLRYRVRDPGIPPTVGSFADVHINPDGSSVPRYTNQQDAFGQGVDVYVNSKGGVTVNPDAPNLIGRVPREGENQVLKPAEDKIFRQTGSVPPGTTLTGAPLTFNVKTGGVAAVDNVVDADGNIVKRIGAQPVVGDYGTPTLTKQGLAYGDQQSIQSLSTPITPDTAPIEANARYAWASLRGIRPGDSIDPSDVAMLEQMYRESQSFSPEGKIRNTYQATSVDLSFGQADAAVAEQKYSAYIANLTRQGVNFTDGSDLPLSSTDLLNQIRNAKDDLLAQAMHNDSSLSTQELGQIANTPEAYITHNFQAKGPGDYLIDPKQYMDINHVQLEYNIGTTNIQHGQILRGLQDAQYRFKVIQDAQRVSAANYLGDQFQQFIVRQDAYQANIKGSRNSFFGANNSDYGSLGQEMQRIGYSVGQFLRQKMKVVDNTLVGPANALRKNFTAAAEVGNFTTVRRSTSETYQFLPPDLATKYGRTADTAVLSNSLVRDKAGAIIDWDPSYTPNGFISAAAKSGNEVGVAEKGLHTYYDLSADAASWERANLAINRDRVNSRNSWRVAQGLDPRFDPEVLYAPPINTSQYPFVAMVKPKAGMAFNDDGVAAITARTKQELDQKIAMMGDGYDIYTKGQLKQFYMAAGEYDASRNFAQSQVNSAMQRKGILNDIFPVTRPENIIADMTSYHSRAEMGLIRDMTEMTNSQFVAEIRTMQQNYAASGISKTGFVSALEGKDLNNPYSSYLNTMLALKDTDTYKLWTMSNEKAEAFASSAFNAARDAYVSAKKGVISYEEANKVSQSFGLGNPYKAATDSLAAYYNIANKYQSTPILSRFVNMANAALGATMIRLDAWQNLIHITSTPVLMLAEAHSAVQGVKDLLTTALPDGSGRMIPSVTKLMFSGTASFMRKDKDYKTLVPMLSQVGVLRESTAELYHSMLQDLSLPPGTLSENALITATKSATDKASRLLGSNLVSTMERYVPGYMAYKIFKAAGYEGTALTDNIMTFVNRVHGNYIANQRPTVFQGPIGSAIGLFQTYQFNLMQQLFRYVENGEGKTLATLAGMQTTMFGLNGLPGFSMVNNAIVGNAPGNPYHKDIYGTTSNLLGKSLGDYLLYGAVSNVFNVGLYGRGDLNPRSLSVVSPNPLDWPAISGGISFLGNMYNTASKIAQGGSVPASLLMGLEHNGLSRPLSGLAQVVQGFSTNADGTLISANRTPIDGWNDILSIANMSRLAGARPLDEAILMDAMYRNSLYTATDESRIASLGSAIKSNLYDHGTLDPGQVQNFAQRYAAAGGYQAKFGQAMTRWTTDANRAEANKIYYQLQTPRLQQIQMQMGGQRLPDFNTSVSSPQ